MRSLAASLAVLALVAAAAGCSVGASPEGSGTVTLTVTRDFGSKTLLQYSRSSVPKDDTIMRFLQRQAKVETRYGGRFVNAIDGVRSSTSGGEREDWFYYVNGTEADAGAAERTLHSGDRVWWDYHEWSRVMRVPAVVGSYPEPFLHGSEGKLYPVRIDCAQDARKACRKVGDRLDAAGVAASTSAIGAAAGKDVLRLVVGEWAEARQDAAARQIEDGPEKSGVFATFARSPSGYELELMDRSAAVVGRASVGAGLVAATRFEEQQPTWVITGTDAAGLERAVGLLDVRLLRDRFAAAAVAGKPVSLPVRVDGQGP